MQVIIQGAGRGIGLALAKQALIAGASHLYLTARHPAASAGYSEMPPSATIRWFSMDFCDPASIATCGAALCAATPHIDRVISTAGLLHDDGIHPEKTITALGTAANDAPLSGQCDGASPVLASVVAVIAGQQGR